MSNPRYITATIWPPFKGKAHKVIDTATDRAVGLYRTPTGAARKAKALNEQNAAERLAERHAPTCAGRESRAECVAAALEVAGIDSQEWTHGTRDATTADAVAYARRELRRALDDDAFATPEERLEAAGLAGALVEYEDGGDQIEELCNCGAAAGAR